MADQLMKEPDLKRWIQRRLGAPTLKVELSDDQLNDAVSEAKRWFAAKKGVDRDFTLQTVAGQVEYDVPDDCDAIIDVWFPDARFDGSFTFSPFLFFDGQIPYSLMQTPESGGMYSWFVQVMQHNEMAKRVLGAENNFLYFPQKRKLFLFPNRTFVGSGTAFVEYKSNLNTIEQLLERDHDLVKRFALAWAKRDLGMIRSKYASLPSAQGQVVLDGRDLLAQADAEFKQLEKEIVDSAQPMPFLIN